MIKKVTLKQLKPGDFVHHFSCDWFHHPFIFNQIVVNNSRTIKRMQKWGITDVFIDTAKATNATPDPTNLVQLAAAAPVLPPPTHPIREELNKATIVKHEARAIACDMINDIRQGHTIKVEQAYPMLDRMENSVSRNQDALMFLVRIRKKDEYTMMHSIGVGALALALCRNLQISHGLRRKLAIGALLHDVGKIRVPDHILNKPGKLSAAELVEMQMHALFSSQIFAETSNHIPKEAMAIALQHHERIDGSGYPLKLHNEEISLGARITSVVDVFDALTADRCYRKGIETFEALAMLYDWSNNHFDQRLAHMFIRCVGVYPVGSLVRLESGLVGMVMESTGDLLRPKVKLLYNATKLWPVSPKIIDLSLPLGQGGGDRIIGHEYQQSWNLNQKVLLKLLQE